MPKADLDPILARPCPGPAVPATSTIAGSSLPSSPWDRPGMRYEPGIGRNGKRSRRAKLPAAPPLAVQHINDQQQGEAGPAATGQSEAQAELLGLYNLYNG